MDMFTVCLDDRIINKWIQTDELSEVKIAEIDLDIETYCYELVFCKTI